MIAKVLLREQPHYRKQAFVEGLRRAGYTISSGMPKSKADVLVIWNRYGSFEHAADSWERHGGTVLVAENCYIGAKGEAYAISLSEHHAGLGEREPEMDIAPWRDGEHVLVLGQRGVGSRRMASPPNWHVRIAATLKTERPIRVRSHPGNNEPKISLSADLDGAHCCVVWSSGGGVKALVAGVPVFYCAPHWIAQDGAVRVGDVEKPLKDEGARRTALRRVAGSQFTVAEIERGEPFARLAC